MITMNFESGHQEGAPVSADHRVVGLAAVDAARDAGNRWVFPEQLDGGLEPWNGIQMVCVAGSNKPTHGVDVSDFIERGIASLQEHRVYLENLSQQLDPSTLLRSRAEARGKLLGCHYAVVFQVFKV